MSAAEHVTLDRRIVEGFVAGHPPMRVVERPQLRQRKLRDGTEPGGRSINCGVVAHDELVVERSVHVELDGVGTGRDRQANGEQRA